MWRTVPTSGPGHPMPVEPGLGHSGDDEDDEPAGSESPRPRVATVPVPAPDLIGMTPQDARRFARFAEVRLIVEERPTDSGLRGRVFRQDPAPGTDVRPGDEVTAFVGARPLVVVPDVSGVDEQEAIGILHAADLAPSRRVMRRSGAVAVGHVLRTRPRAGTEVPVGARIAVIVAEAPRPKRARSRRDDRRSRDGWLPDGAFLSMPIGE